MIYLDHQATTPVDPRVLEAMLPYFGPRFGNAASHAHAFGWDAEAACEEARAEVAALLGAEPAEIVFTAGATEATNLALKGLAAAGGGGHVVTTAVEHKATLEVCRWLEAQGVALTVLPVDETGRVSPEAVAAALRPDTLVVSVMHANNEIGTLMPLAAIGSVCRARGVPFHVDAAQTFGKLPIDVQAMAIDLLSLSAHKVYGPKGVGALYVRRRPRRVRLSPLLHGGGQEGGLRPGTLNVPGVVGLGAAAAIARERMGEDARHARRLAELLRALLDTGLRGVRLNGHPTERLPGNLHLSFAGLGSGELLAALDGVAVSSGSACTGSSSAPSHVLAACVREPEALADAALRFGVGRFTTEAEVRQTAAMVIAAVRRLRPAR